MAAPLIRLPIVFSNVHRTSALLDSGAIASLLSLQVFQQLPNNLKISTPYKYPHITFQSASGSPIVPVGLFDITFSIANISTSHTFYIITSLPETCILGMDFLSKVGFVMLPGQNRVTITVNGTVSIDASDPAPRRIASVVMTKSHDFDHLPPRWQREFHSSIESNADMFATSMSDIGHTRVAKHTIETEGPLIYLPPYRVAQTHRVEIDKQIQEMLDGGIIRPSNSPYSAPIIMVNKKDGGSRMVIDYRKLNSQTR